MAEHPVRRRTIVLGGVGVAVTAAAGAYPLLTEQRERADQPRRVSPTSQAVTVREQQRSDGGTGRAVAASLRAAPSEVDLGGRVVTTWAYNGKVPGPTVRARAGDRLDVELRNDLPAPTTVHWHGLAIRNDMDGVPNLTQAPVDAGGAMRYSFVAPDPGTYWFHPHVGLQRERGLYAPLILDDPADPGDYDVEFVVVLDDWLDGAAGTPEDVLAALRAGGATAQYQAPVQAGAVVDQSSSWIYDTPASLATPPAGVTPITTASALAGSVAYPIYLINGRLPTAPTTFRARPGQRARIRVINAGGTTTFRVALGGHRLTVTHTDGFPVDPVVVDTLQIASGERYDLLVTLDDGVFPLVAVAEGRAAQGYALVRTSPGASAPPENTQPGELAGRLLRLADLRAAPGTEQPSTVPQVSHTVALTGDMAAFAWRINAQTYDPRGPFDAITPAEVRSGQRVRLEFINQTPKYHPMHLHGHTFTLSAVGPLFGGTERPLGGARKDTVMVPPGQRILVDLDADNPGQWLLHCHNAYHMATGMATVLSYTAVP